MILRYSEYDMEWTVYDKSQCRMDWSNMKRPSVGFGNLV